MSISDKILSASIWQLVERYVIHFGVMPKNWTPYWAASFSCPVSAVVEEHATCASIHMVSCKLVELGSSIGVSQRNKVSETKEDVCSLELFLILGKLVRYYPIAGWLKTACCYVKRRASGKIRLMKMITVMQEILTDKVDQFQSAYT